MSDNRKRAIRALMAETGLTYCAAMRQHDAEHPRPERPAPVESYAPVPASPLDLVFVEPESKAS